MQLNAAGSGLWGLRLILLASDMMVHSILSSATGSPLEMVEAQRRKFPPAVLRGCKACKGKRIRYIIRFVPIISISNPKEVPALHCNVFEALTRETLANEIHSNSKLRWDHMSGSLLTKIIVYVFFLLYFSSILYYIPNCGLFENLRKVAPPVIAVDLRRRLRRAYTMTTKLRRP